LLYVADAMTGQDAVKSAGEFHHRVGHDWRGADQDGRRRARRRGAELSVGVVGVPIGVCRDTASACQDLEAFDAGRLVSRMLGMGDVLSLIERAERRSTIESRERLEQKTRLDDFTLEDFAISCAPSRRWGRSSSASGMIPAWARSKS
jgi:signal recognition particle subunit SRP54